MLHERKRLVEETHYYADGLKMEALCAKAYNKPHNAFGYQGDYSEEEEETGYNEFDLRLYDPQTGRWISTDPYDQFASPYIGMGNDPVNIVDPDGGFVWDAMAMVWGGIGGLISGGVIAMANGEDPVKGALLGAVGGTALGALVGNFAAGGSSAAVTAGATVGANLGKGFLGSGNGGRGSVNLERFDNDDIINVNTKTKEVVVDHTDGDADVVSIDGQKPIKVQKGVTEQKYKQAGYDIFHPTPVGMKATDIGLGVLLGTRLLITIVKTVFTADKSEFDVSKTYMDPKQMSPYIRELESGFKDAGSKIPASQKLTPNQLNALSENLKQTITKTIPNAKTNEAIINQLSNPRWRFIDQVPGGREAINTAIKGKNIVFPF